MTTPTENGDNPDHVRGRASKPDVSDTASDPTFQYTPNLGGDASDELVLNGLELLSAEVPIPARLGKYEIQGQIGRGGMGIVWKGFDPDLRRTVAIKVLSPHLAQSPVARRRFQREARAAAAISHDNVLTIHSVEEQGETPFLVMEFVAGQSLKEYVTDKGKLGVIEVIRLSAQISQGLAAAHARGVIHRDVKPANVMLHEGATRVRLMDFGLARVGFDNADLTSHDHTVGTPAYMAPEQICGRDIDARADLFSLGCLMYCMLAGQSPFLGRNHAETIHKIVDYDPPQLHDLDPAIPVVLSEIVERLLKKNSDERYQSAFEVAETLSRILTQLNQTRTAELGNVLNSLPRTAVAANKPTEWAGSSTPSRRRVALLAMAVALAVTAGLASRTFWPGSPKSHPSVAGPPPTNAVVTNGLATNGVGTAVSGTSAGIPTVTKLTRIMVGPGPDATCATLGEALQRASENCTITVVGPGPFAESIAISGAGLNGLTLKGKPRATLRNSVGALAILSIKDVAGVTVEGFDFDLEGGDIHGIHLAGTVDSVALKDCTFTQVSDNSRWSLLAISSNARQSTSAVRVERCRFDSRGGAMCLSVDALGDTVAGLICERCQFSSPHTQLYAAQSCRRLRVADTVFVGGTNAINLDIKSWSPDSRFEIVNNTFLGTKHWLGFIASFRDAPPTGPTDSRVCNNLILGGERIQGGPDQLTIALNTWKFSSNWWERDETTIIDADWGGRLAKPQPRLHDIPVRDIGHAEFLVPAAGSPLLTSGVAGDLPAHIGAKARASSH